MPAQRAKGTPIPEPFTLDSVTLEWLERRYPQVDPEIAAERFSFWAAEYMYANWMRTFQNFITREADNNKLSPMLKKTKTLTVREEFELLIAEAKKIGARLPNEQETLSSYRAELEKRRHSNVHNLNSTLKQFGR